MTKLSLPTPPPSFAANEGTLSDWAAFDALTPEERLANALSDPDNPPLTAKNAAHRVHWKGGIREKWAARAAARRETERTEQAAENQAAPGPTTRHLPADIARAFPTDRSVESALRLVLRLRAEIAE